MNDRRLELCYLCNKKITQEKVTRCVNYGIYRCSINSIVFKQGDMWSVFQYSTYYITSFIIYNSKVFIVFQQQFYFLNRNYKNA
jgi:hypothetical protein